MSRRRNPGVVEMLFEVLEFVFRIVPPWTSIPAAIAGYTAIVWWFSSNVSNPVFASATNQLWHIMGAAFAVVCLLAGFKGWQFRAERQRFIEQEIDLDWVKQLDWREFEKHVAAVYEQRGFCVQHIGGSGPDGGVDIKLIKDGRTSIVQCKHWRTGKSV